MTSRFAKRRATVVRCRGESGPSALVLLLAGVVLSSSWIESSTAVSLAPVYWNSTNPMFKISKNDHIIDVKPFDDIDFVCPFYSATHGAGPGAGVGARRGATALAEAADSHEEQYLIYRVSKSEYDDCNIYDPEYSSEGGAGIPGTALLILNCSTPRLRRRFTILFEPFQSIPNVPEYKAGRSYYFITTSSGKRHGLNNLYHGACYYSNMKLTVRVSNGLSEVTFILKEGSTMLGRFRMMWGNSISDDVVSDADDSNYGDEFDAEEASSPLSGSRANAVVDRQPSLPVANGQRDQPPLRSSSTPPTLKSSSILRSDAPTPRSLPMTSQPVHRTAHRRKHPTSSTSAAVPSNWPRDVAIRHPQRHHDKQRHRAVNETSSQLVGVTPMSALNLALKPAQRQAYPMTNNSATLRYSSIVIAFIMCVCLILSRSCR